MRWDYLSVDDRPPLGSLCSSGREIARTASMASGWHRADQAAKNAQEYLSAYFRDARLPRGYSKAGRELRSQIQARSAPRSSVAAVSKQVCATRWMAGPLIFTSAVRQDLYRSDTPTTAGQQAENTRLTVSLSEFASGRKSEAPAPAAQQDKTVRPKRNCPTEIKRAGIVRLRPSIGWQGHS